jgi:hypothetical protein
MRTSNARPSLEFLCRCKKPKPQRHFRIRALATDHVWRNIHGEDREVKKLGGFSAPTQDVSAAAGLSRKDTTTAWAMWRVVIRRA